MAFLDNSGDIILDVVLTDHGRKVLARGDGSFQITKFALGDEEVDYSLYNASHASGSAYYDLEILQTPVLEAFTNNASSVKTKLSSYQDMNLLFLPVLKINEKLSSTKRHTNGAGATTNAFLVAVDRVTEGTDAEESGVAVGTATDGSHVDGILFGATFTSNQYIRIDQGMDTTELSPTQTSLMQNMIEDVYIIQIDNRLGTIVDMNGAPVGEDYIDDDNIAYYTVDANTGLVRPNNESRVTSTETIAGPRGSILEFKIGTALELNTSTFLFSKLGSTFLMSSRASSSIAQNVRYIDSIIRVTGMKSGYSIDIPVRFIKTVTS